MNISEFISSVESWARVRGFDQSSPKTQYLSTMEELNEIIEAKSLLYESMLVDAIGDVAVTLVILKMQIRPFFEEKPVGRYCLYTGDILELVFRVTSISGHLRRERWNNAMLSIDESWDCLKLFSNKEGFVFEECCEAAWNEIKNRRGMMIEGSYVKYDDFTEEQRSENVKREKQEELDPSEEFLISGPTISLDDSMGKS